MASVSGYKVSTITELSEEGVHTEDPEEGLELENIRCSSCKTVPYAAITSCLISTCSQMPSMSLV